LKQLVAVIAVHALALTAYADVPPPELRAPIFIPSNSARTSDFARELYRACSQLKNATSADGSFSEDVITVPPPQPFVWEPPLKALKHTCDSISGLQVITTNDLTNLHAFFASPNHGALADKITIAAGQSPRQGAIPFSPMDSAGTLLSNVVQGFANFIYDRAKAEAALYLTQQVTKLLCSDTAKPFFPNLCVAFANMDASVSLAAIGSYLAVAAKKDLEQLPDTALAYGLFALGDGSKDGSEKTTRQAGRDAIVAVRMGLAYYKAVAAGRAPLDVARSLHLVKSPMKTYAPKVFLGISLASEIVDAAVLQDKWKEVSATDKLQLGCYAVGIFLTIEHNHPELTFTLSTRASIGLDLLSTEITSLTSFVTDLAALLQRLEQARTSATSPTISNTGGGAAPANNGGFANPTLQQPAPPVLPSSNATTNTTTLTPRDWVSAVTLLLQRLVQEGTTLCLSFNIISQDDANQLGRVERVLVIGESIVSAASTSEIIMNALTLVDELWQDVGADLAGKSPLSAEMRQMLAFLAQVAQAHSADEVSNILQAAAVPVGTYKLKFRKPMFAINAIVGVSLGGEILSLNKTSKSGAFGPFAPIGIHATVPFGNHWMNVGGFLSVVNVGTLVTARFQSDSGIGDDGTKKTVDTAPTVDFLNLLSPGLFLTMGIARSPLMVGVGAQVIPARTIEVVDKNMMQTTTTIPAVQVLFIAGLDVPIFTF